MAGKRRPGTNLNQDNWDQEDAKEQAGQWTPVSNDELGRRKIHVAKRRSAAGSGSNGGSTASSPFAQFSFMKRGSAGAPTSSSSMVTTGGETHASFKPSPLPSVASSKTTSGSAETKSGFGGLNIPRPAATGIFVNPNHVSAGGKFSAENSGSGKFKNPSSSHFGQAGSSSSVGFGGSGSSTFGGRQDAPVGFCFVKSEPSSAASSAGAKIDLPSNAFVPDVKPSLASRSHSDTMEEYDEDFYSNLASLNEAFSRAVAGKDFNCTILVPLFREYETYVEQLRREFRKNATFVLKRESRKNENSQSKGAPPTSEEGPGNSGFKLPISGSAPMGGLGFGSDAKPPAFGSSTGTSTFNESATAQSSGFSFGSLSNAPSAGASGLTSVSSAGKAPPASFFSLAASAPSTNTPGTTSTPSAGGGLFSGITPTSTFGGAGTGAGSMFSGIAAHGPGAGGAGGFSFSAAPSASSSATSTAPGPSGDRTDDEPYVPPEPEVNLAQEPGAIYSIKCKLFYSKSGQFVEKGVGMLHLKPTTGAKTQLFIRAVNTLGNILLNVKLQESTPMSRQGKNNVLLVCVPNPPLDPRDTAPATQAASLLIKVKSEADADELKAKLEKYKVSCQNGAKTPSDNDHSGSTEVDSNESNAHGNDEDNADDDDSDIVVLD